MAGQALGPAESLQLGDEDALDPTVGFQECDEAQEPGVGDQITLQFKGFGERVEDLAAVADAVGMSGDEDRSCPCRGVVVGPNEENRDCLQV